MDLKGVGISKVSSVYGYVRQASVISQDHYPERLGKLYLINAPWGFSGVFSVVKGFLDPVTVQKIHVLGSNYQAELLSQVPKENLPKQFGGTCECPGGCELSDEGPWQEKQWAKPPKWATKKEDAAVDDATKKMEATKLDEPAGADAPVQAKPAAEIKTETDASEVVLGKPDHAPA